jgi:hypothetical protein
MDKTALVGLDVEKGSKILTILDGAGLNIRVALWAFLSDYEDWRLILSSPKFDAEPKGGYRLYHRALEAAGIALEETPLTMIFSANDRFIRDLRKKYAKAKRSEGIRIYVQNVGDRFVEEAYVYRA